MWHADTKAGPLPFGEQVPTLEREISAIQRQMQRQERTANPDNYEPDFQSRKVAKP